MRVKKYLLLAIAFLSISLPCEAASPNKLAYQLKKAGLKAVNCPKYVANLKSGMASMLERRAMVCVNPVSGKRPALNKFFVKGSLLLNGRAAPGVAPLAIKDQEGDVQTVPFKVQNYPAIIRWSVRNSNLNSLFTISLVDSETGQNQHVFDRIMGSGSDEIVWNVPGNFYLRLQGRGDQKAQTQPLFSVSVGFLDPYVGSPVSNTALKSARIKTSACPRYMIDSRTSRYFPLAGHTCTNSDDLPGTGITMAPFSTGLEFFMASEIFEFDSGGDFSLPFRITQPTTLTYSVFDPAVGSGKYGTTNISLIDLTTGRVAHTLVSVTGSIQNTSTSINIPGDYYLSVQTMPAYWEKLGDISWSISLSTGS